MQDNTPTNTIKHLVISGGGVTGFSFFGSLRESSERNIWNIENIETIYGTSIGALIGVMLALKYDWNTLETYLVNRPWQNVFKVDMYSIIGSIQDRGIFQLSMIKELLTPLFLGKDISTDITMLEFYELTKIDIHIFITEIKSFTLINISHKTHPDWKVVDAVYASSSLPVVFAPLHKDELFYCDGGFLANYPLIHCINNGANPKEILGCVKTAITDEKADLYNDSTLLDYIMVLLNNTVKNIIRANAVLEEPIAVEYCVPAVASSIYYIFNAVANMEERAELIKIGKQLVIDAGLT
jgi:predicted acylesterase/phospholipase RssA